MLVLCLFECDTLCALFFGNAEELSNVGRGSGGNWEVGGLVLATELITGVAHFNIFTVRGSEAGKKGW